MEEHYGIYCQGVEKYNALAEKLHDLHHRPGAKATIDIPSLKIDVIALLAAIRNHELYFDMLGSGPTEPPADFSAVVTRHFATFDAYLSDLRQTAVASRGWTWTAWDPTEERLFNFIGGAHHGFPLWSATPILAIDLFEHAYFYDYGWRKNQYVDAIINNLNWPRIAQRYNAVKVRRLSPETA